MARQKLVSLVVSAVCLAVFALVMVKGMAARERRSFEASRALLDAGAQQVESRLAVMSDDLPEIAAHIAADSDLSTQLSTLSKQITMLAAMPKPGERMKQLVVGQTTKVNDRLSTLRGELARASEVDAVALLDEQGLVLLSDSPTFVIGYRVRVPALDAASNSPAVQSAQKRGGNDGVETIGGSVRVVGPGDAAENEAALDENTKVDGRPANGDARTTVDGRAPSVDARDIEIRPADERPVAAARAAKADVVATMDDIQTETVRNAIAAGASKGAIVVDSSIVHLGAAPLSFKGKLVGVVLVERRVRSLPQPVGVDAVLAIDDKVRLGRAPEGAPASVTSAPTDTPFLLVPRIVRSVAPSLGEVGVSPLFIPADTIGIWARRFSVAGVPSASGYVFTDVSPAFAELGGLQLMTIVLAIAVLMVHVLLISTAGMGLLRGIDRVSDFMSQKHEGVGDSNRLVERELPSRLHRLARLVNKSVERASGSAIVSGRNPRLDDVIALQDPGEVPDVHELDFGGIADKGAKASLDADADVLDVVRQATPKPAGTGSPFVAADRLNASPDEGSAALLASLEELSQSLTSEEPQLDLTAPPPRAPSRTQAIAAGPAPVLAASEPNGVMPAKVAEAAPPSDTDAEGSRESHYRDVFRQFVETRETCGETTSDVTYDRFVGKLTQSREAVMAKHDCTDVRFQVYVKNGKAALKATPFK